ncbi:MAG TPA: hypothetical protein PKC76_17980 [Saprospiraceae bacterium]|nr:hypothetical protein [Saprospiraceae bacterium]HMP26023.1 hypothetical protein [Saprospiraceae bacterium]
MTVHKFQVRLDSQTVKLPDVEDLIGKTVEITIREIIEESPVGNGGALLKFLAINANPTHFAGIIDPWQWQKSLRDEWE